MTLQPQSDVQPALHFNAKGSRPLLDKPPIAFRVGKRLIQPHTLARRPNIGTFDPAISQSRHSAAASPSFWVRMIVISPEFVGLSGPGPLIGPFKSTIDDLNTE